MEGFVKMCKKREIVSQKDRGQRVLKIKWFRGGMWPPILEVWLLDTYFLAEG